MRAGSMIDTSSGPAVADRRHLVAAVLLLPLVVALAVAAFAWPAARIAPRAVPLGLVGPPAALAPLEGRLTSDGAFVVRRYGDEAAAREAIRRREVYGALVATPNGLTVLTASAASPAVAQLLQGVAGGAASVAGGAAPPVRVVDVVPADPDDPRMAVFGSALLPLVLAGILIGAAVSLLSRAGAAQLVALLIAAPLAALVVVGIVQGWLGALGGGWAMNWGALTLIVLAVAATVAAMRALIGMAGIALAAVAMIFVGNTTSGITAAPELLPRPLGGLGQLLPPGAGGSLLRSTAFFDGNGAGGPLAVLVVWVALGLAIIGLVAWRRSAPAVVAG